MSESSQPIESSYPYPIAVCHRKMRHIYNEKAAEKFVAYAELFEVFLKYIAIIAVQDLRTNGRLSLEVKTIIRDFSKPGLGHWINLLDAVCHSQNSANLRDCVVAQAVSQFFHAKPNTPVKEAAESLNRLFESKVPTKTHGQIFAILSAFRNKSTGHGARISEDENRERVAILSTIINDLLSRATFLSAYSLVYVDEVKVVDPELHEIKYRACTGTVLEPKVLMQSPSLVPQNIYLMLDSDLGHPPISLHPLLTLYHCKNCSHDELFLFNELRRVGPVFLSYNCGHFKFQDMLRDEFERLLSITLSKPIDFQNINGIQSNAEAEEKSDEFLAGAMARIAGGRYFEALDYLRHSMEQADSSEAEYYFALVTLAIRNPPSEALYHLKNTTRLDPSNDAAQLLLDRVQEILPQLEDIQSATNEQLNTLQSIARQIVELSVARPDAKPVYYFFTPKLFRSSWLLFWSTLAIVGFGFRQVISNLLDIPAPLTVQFLKLSMVIAFLAIAFVVTNSIRSIYFSLLQQVSGRMREQFAEWFSEQSVRTFGSFSSDGNLLQRLQLHKKTNQSYCTFATVLFFIAVNGSLWLTSISPSDAVQTAAVAFDYVILWGIVIPFAPAMLRCFLLFKAYSNLPLRPVVSSVNGFTLNRVGRMFFLVSLPWTACYIFYTLIGYLTFSNELVLSQLILFYFMVSLGMVWTLVTPIYLSLALIYAKERLLVQYGEHIDLAFRKFVESPNQENAERYNWLTTQQAQFLKIRVAAMSPWTLFGVISINLFIVATAVAYPFYKYKIDLATLISSVGEFAAI